MTSSDRVRGHLDGLLLGLLAAGPGHGYRLIEALREETGGEFDLPEGTVYPALHRLERSGLVESRWERGTTRRRRVYAITGAGRGLLAAERAQWPRFAAAVQAVLRPGEAM
jgi:DNA-binding PadR family transcriptional regulator